MTMTRSIKADRGAAGALSTPIGARWGTDWPHPNVTIKPNDGDLVDLIPLYAPDTAIQNKLLVTNPERLFKFEAKN